ncbi:hypothetical protein KKF61_06185, partial [Patescibacteria group bacterium]|nr:hypothetical protein [Patescibacteria group bacterium]
MRKGYDQQMGVERRMMSDLDTRGVLGYATESVEFNSIIKSWESVRPKPGDFKNVYPDNEIATDAASVAEIKRSA